MKLFSEKQLKILKSIPAEFRILHCDATGGLVSIPKYMREYNQFDAYRIGKYYSNNYKYTKLIN